MQLVRVGAMQSQPGPQLELAEISPQHRVVVAQIR
jgi:hypothetical protein